MKFIRPGEFFTDRARTCCITGHRRKDLPCGGDTDSEPMRRLLSMLALLCSEAYGDGYRTFVSGMAEGIDLMCMKLLFDMKRSGRYEGMRLVCALPYSSQRRELRLAVDRYYYDIFLEECDCAVVCSTITERGRYKLRNQFMVENSSRIIGAMREKTTGSGTLQTVNMAKNAGLRLEIVSLDANRELFMGSAEDIKGFRRVKL
ncbi:MAG: DUF1273 family protein [Ruminococcus sp.]|nr:DUF1273 family protein [Ruminococcus sp.]